MAEINVLHPFKGIYNRPRSRRRQWLLMTTGTAAATAITIAAGVAVSLHFVGNQPEEKNERVKALSTIVKRMMEKGKDYRQIKEEVRAMAWENNCSVENISIVGTVTKSSDDVYLDLKETSENLFDIQFISHTPLSLGWLNLKWKVKTDKGTLVLKQFSKERWQRFGIEKVALEQQIALHEQVRQYENGTPCPKIWTHNGNVIQISHAGERFVLMEFMPGQNLFPGTLNVDQMYSLGRATAYMHNVFHNRTHGSEHSPKFLPPSLEERLEYWRGLVEKARRNERIIGLIERQIRATERFRLDLINSCEPGWAHRDLWVDNILFKGNELSAILDFDRVAFDYPELDIGRAIMSGSLNGDQFNSSTATAFVEGYRTKRALQKGTVIRSLRLLWYLESVWWIAPNLNCDGYQVVQFENEMVWLAEHLMKLNEIFSEL